jgi:hypothetical protein
VDPLLDRDAVWEGRRRGVLFHLALIYGFSITGIAKSHRRLSRALASVSDCPSKAAFESAGTEIVVPNVELPRKIARVEVSASARGPTTGNTMSSLVSSYRGKQRTPSIRRITHPDLNLKGVDVQEKLELPPGLTTR